MKWEYKTYVLKEELNLLNRKFDESYMEDILNKFGKDGYELVNALPSQRDTGETTKIIFFFKRPVK